MLPTSSSIPQVQTSSKVETLVVLQLLEIRGSTASPDTDSEAT